LKRWPNGWHLEIYKEHPVYPPDGVVVEDLKEERELFYTSSAKACESMDIDIGTFRSIIRHSKLFKNRYKFKKFDIRKNLGHPME
jgi:hypothetical protein